MPGVAAPPRLVPPHRNDRHIVGWHGTRAEGLELVAALDCHCSCGFTPQGLRVTVCASHQLLLSDQRALDGLLFSRRIVAQLRSEEFRPQVAPTQVAADF